MTEHPEALLRKILALTHVALFDAWLDSLELIRFESVDASLFALEPAQVKAGTSWYDNVYPTDRVKLRSFLARTHAPQSKSSVDYRVIVGDGELLWVRQWTLDIHPMRGRRTRLRAAVMAIPEQKHLEWECLRVSERECNRIGQELHDDLCQVLAGLTFMMRVILQRARQLDPGLAADIEELSAHVTGATERVRSMAHGLFPAQLNYGSLRQALSAYAAEARGLLPVQINLNFAPKLPPHNPEQIIHVYRIVQEAVSNAVRHGNASVVAITVRRASDGLEILIEDNGKGFPVASARPEGIGLHVMEYRARVLGGTLEWKNLSPQGVAARLTYPVAHTTSRQQRKPLATL